MCERVLVCMHAHTLRTYFVLTVGEEEELPLMGCPDGLDSACNNVTIPTIIIYSQDRQLLQGEKLQCLRHRIL